LTETWQNAEAPEGSPMEIVPLGPGFAAELRGVMLAEIAAADAWALGLSAQAKG
jgi:hypothetical protein